jgi:hypothetical protein
MIARSTAGKMAPPPSDEIAQRLRQQTTARVKESRKLLAASKRRLKRTKARPWDRDLADALDVRHATI